MLRLLSPFSSGLLWAWGYLVLFVSPSFFVDSPLAGIGFSEGPYLIASLCGYAAMAILCERAGSGASLPASWAGCVGMVLGVLMVSLLRLGAVPESAELLLAASVLAGVGLAACTTAWGVVLARLDADTLESTALSWCPSFALVSFVVSFAALAQDFAQPIIYALLVVLPLAAQLGLVRTARMGGEGDSVGFAHANAQARGSSLKIVRADALTLVNLLVSFLSLSFVWSAVSSLRSGTFGVTTFVFAVGALVLWGVLWFALRNTRRFGLSTLYAWTLPLALLGVACASVGGVSMLTVAFVMVLAVDLGFEVVAKLSILLIGKRWSGHEGAAFALWVAIINMAGLMGPRLWDAICPLADSWGFSTVMLFAFIPFALAVVFAFGGGGSFFPGPRADAKSTESAVEAAPDPVQAFCDSLEDAYGLTPREAEVVSLLARGCSRAYVRETLYISKGTVDTHAYRAYAKMGIKSKDELFKLAHRAGDRS